jgi:Fic family protein
MQNLLKIISKYPHGISAGTLEKQTGLTRPTLNRKLKEAVDAKLIIAKGNGPARIYLDADEHRPIRQYFDTPYTERKIAIFREELLDYKPALGDVNTSALIAHKGLRPLEKKDMVPFLVDFSCASSVLEGGSYSLLDTQALIEYGEKAEGKPLSDAFLVLNHKNAFEYLYDHLSLDSIYEVHTRLTDDHDSPELKKAAHFLGKERQGVVRNYEGEDVNIGQSTYVPPLRPGTGYIKKMLAHVLDTSASISDPMESALYLLTRLPYLQPFADGNKRTSRAMCNVPLLKAGMPPISFIDFGKRDYILSILAFYELGDTKMASHTFAKAYEKSCRRLP